MREAVFDILGERVADAAVLDLFAGSGALGLEALSRGAASAVLVEPAPAALSVLRKNLETLEAEGAEVLPLDYRQAIAVLARRGAGFSLVFLDPPYARGIAEASAAAVGRAGLVLPGGAVVVEEAARTPGGPFPERWERIVDRRYGDTRVTVFSVKESP